MQYHTLSVSSTDCSVKARNALIRGCTDHFVAGVSDLQFPIIQTCFSFTLPDMVFGASLFHFQPKGNIFFFLWPYRVNTHTAGTLQHLGHEVVGNRRCSGYCTHLFTDWDRISTILSTNDYPAQHQLSDNTLLSLIHYTHSHKHSTTASTKAVIRTCFRWRCVECWRRHN